MMSDDNQYYNFCRSDEESTDCIEGSYQSYEDDEDHASGYCYSPQPATNDAAPPKKKPTPRKTLELISKERKQLEKDLAAHKKTLEQTKKKMDTTKKKLQAIKKKETDQKKKILAQNKKLKAQIKKSPQKGQKAVMVKKRIVEEKFYL